jgi:hypothetical protein
MKGSKDSALHDKLPALSKPSVLLSEMMRAVLLFFSSFSCSRKELDVGLQFQNISANQNLVLFITIFNTLNFLMSMFTLLQYLEAWNIFVTLRRRSRLCAGYSLLVCYIISFLYGASLLPLHFRK